MAGFSSGFFFMGFFIRTASTPSMHFRRFEPPSQQPMCARTLGSQFVSNGGMKPDDRGDDRREKNDINDSEGEEDGVRRHPTCRNHPQDTDPYSKRPNEADILGRLPPDDPRDKRNIKKWHHDGTHHPELLNHGRMIAKG